MVYLKCFKCLRVQDHFIKWSETQGKGLKVLVKKMYYYYHQYLQGVLAAERWATAEDLRHRPYSVLGVPTHKEASELFSRVKKTFGKEMGSHITVMKESTVFAPDSWPMKTQSSAESQQEVQARHPTLLAYLFTNEVGNFQLKDSRELMIPESITENEVFQEKENLFTIEVQNQPVKEKPVLNFEQLHENFSSKKKFSTMTDEDGKIILENTTLTFDGYQLAQDIDAASHLLSKIFHHIEDISDNYGEALRHIDAQISDELHFIEFADVDASRCVKSYKRLQELRVKRRCVKDSMLMANLLVRTMGMELPKKLSNVSEKINHLDQRTYVVRVPEEFNH